MSRDTDCYVMQDGLVKDGIVPAAGFSDFSDLSDGSEDGETRWLAPIPPTAAALLAATGGGTVHDVESSSTGSGSLSVDKLCVSDLSTHIGLQSYGGVIYPKAQEDFRFSRLDPTKPLLFDASKPAKKSNFLPPLNPRFDEEAVAKNCWFGGIKRESAVLNPLVDFADSELLQSMDVNDILMDHFYPLMDVTSSPENRTRSGIVERAWKLARLYDPLLLYGCSPVDWNLPALEKDSGAFLDAIEPQFRRGGAEARGAMAAADYNWDTFPFPDGEDLDQQFYGNIVDLIRHRQNQNLPGRINLERISEYLGDYPGFLLLREVVVEGIRVHTDPEYRKNPYENLRSQELALQGVIICKHAMDS